MRHRVAAIPGDGIGKEVVPEGQRVLDAAARRFGFELEWTTFDWSCEVYAKTGRMTASPRIVALRGRTPGTSPDKGVDLNSHASSLRLLPMEAPSPASAAPGWTRIRLPSMSAIPPRVPTIPWLYRPDVGAGPLASSEYP